VKAAAKRPSRRLQSPGAAALKRRAEEPARSSRVVAGAREVWSSLRARLEALFEFDRKPGTATPIRPSQIGVDRVLVGTALALCAFGMVMVFSSGAVFAAKKYGDATYFLKREVVYAILGLAAFSLATRIDYGVYRRLAYPLLFASVVSLVVVLKMGSRAGGAVRWFRLGPLSFQPSELAKFALCVYLARR
jgi:cell division protein FtsW